MPSEEKDGRFRSYKILLYPDNELHQKVFETICNEFEGQYIGIKHNAQIDELTGELLSKEHYHILLRFENQHWWHKTASAIGFGEDVQFIRPISPNFVKGESFDKGLLYLVHANTPDKEQYSTNELFGSSALIAQAILEIKKYKARQVFTPEAVKKCIEYILSCQEYISIASFTLWAVENDLYKGAQSPLVRQAVAEHNQHIAAMRCKWESREHIIQLNGVDYDERDFKAI